MATNVFFNNFENSMEQTLIEDLVIESIRIYGHDVWFIPRTLVATDDLLNEDDLSEFTSAYFVEMYIKNVDGFEGEGDFLSKFGLQIRDEMTLTLARRVFELDVTQYTADERPNEGDLIYFPLTNKMFEITHVEHETTLGFYQLGSLQAYDLRVELFEYSNETFATGVPEIDDLYQYYETTSNTTMAFIEAQDPFADNLTIQTAANSTIIDKSESTPFELDNDW